MKYHMMVRQTNLLCSDDDCFFRYAHEHSQCIKNTGWKGSFPVGRISFGFLLSLFSRKTHPGCTVSEVRSAHKIHPTSQICPEIQEAESKRCNFQTRFER